MNWTGWYFCELDGMVLFLVEKGTSMLCGKKYKICAASFSPFLILFNPQKKFSKEGKISFYINIYHCLLIKLIKTNYRIPWNQTSREEIQGIHGESDQIHLKVKEKKLDPNN